MTTKTRIQLRRGNLADLPTLAEGEAAFTLDTHTLYIGNGSINYLVGGDGGLQNNLLTNGGFDICQRSKTPDTLFSLTDNKYSADRWRINRATTDLQYQRLSALNEVGLTSLYYGRYKKITNAGKFVVYQPLEAANCLPLRGRNPSFQIKLRGSSNVSLRMALLQLTAPGTADAIPTSLVSAYNADGSDPTFAANISIVSVQTINVTSVWQSFTLSATIPTTSLNLLCGLWTNSAAPANFTLDLAEAGLYPANIAQVWTPRLLAQEHALCLRTFEAQYNTPSDAYRPFASGYCYGGTTLQGILSYSPKRILPAVSRSADSTPGWWKSNGALLALSSATSTAIIYVSESSCVEKDVFAAGNFAAGDGSLLTAYSTNAAYYYFDAEL